MTPFYLSKIEGKTAWLRDEEAKHCRKVMRKREGEDVIGVDGQGFMYRCRISGGTKHAVELKILEVVENWGEHPFEIALLISPLHKTDRFEWLVEKAVELGVTRIQPYLGKHTVKTGMRVDRLGRIAAAALKQCLRSRMPVWGELVNLEEALQVVEGHDLKLLAHGPTGQPLSRFNDQWPKAKSVALLIGPEGDFAEPELETVKEAGFETVGLGHNRLRSETAAIHFLGLVKASLNY